MRKNFGSKSWLYPMPVLIVGTYDENGVPNAMNAVKVGRKRYLGAFSYGLEPVCNKMLFD